MKKCLQTRAVERFLSKYSSALINNTKDKSVFGYQTKKDWFIKKMLIADLELRKSEDT